MKDVQISAPFTVGYGVYQSYVVMTDSLAPPRKTAALECGGLTILPISCIVNLNRSVKEFVSFQFVKSAGVWFESHADFVVDFSEFFSAPHFSEGYAVCKTEVRQSHAEFL